MEIVCIDNTPLSSHNIEALSKVGKITHFHTDPQNDREAIERIKDAEIVISYWYKFPLEFFEAAKKLRLLCVSAIDWIDVDYAQQHNIMIHKVSGYATEAVAEHTIALMLLVTRRTHEAIASVKQGIWDSYKGLELQGKTLGIIGCGAIGKRVSEIARNGFDMSVKPLSSKHTYRDLAELLSTSDIVSIHASMNRDTEYMLNEKEFSQMKDGVIIINTARGKIINEDALIKYTKNGKVSAAGLDVLIHEPLDLSNELHTLPNVVITPHMGYNTQNSDSRFGDMVTNYIIQYINSKTQS